MSVENLFVTDLVTSMRVVGNFVRLNGIPKHDTIVERESAPPKQAELR